MTDVAEEIGERIVALLPRLRRFARSLSRNQHDADDLAQAAVERALRGSRAVSRRREPGGVDVRHHEERVDRQHRRARGGAAKWRCPRTAASTPRCHPCDTDASLWSVSEAMNKLPEDQRLAVALVLVEGMSYKEAAAVLEIPIGTLTSRLARGRAALAAVLSQDRQGRRVNYDDETLMAYADGELDERQSAEIASAMEARSGAGAPRRAASCAARRSGGGLRLRAGPAVTGTTAGVARGAAGEPADHAHSGKLLQFPARSARASAPPWRAREWGAMAASVVLGALISWKLFAPAESALVTASNGALVAQRRAGRRRSTGNSPARNAASNRC